MRIMLSTCDFAEVDEEDYHFLAKWSWQCSDGYATRSERYGPRILDQAKTIYMHVEVAKRAEKYIDGLEVDHIDRDRLNNHRGNLRAATHSMNCANVGVRPSSKTGHPGVTLDSSTNKWLARTPKVNGKYKHVGLFETIEEAVATRKAMIERME